MRAAQSKRIQIDFDGEAQKLVEDAYTQAKEFQYPINEQCRRDYLAYRAFIDISEHDNSLPHIALPKLFSIVEHKTAQDIKALMGMRPYIPLEARRPEMRYASDLYEEILDDLLDRGGFYRECVHLLKIKTMSGVSFMEFLPDREIVNGMPMFRIKPRMLAPWEVYIDPFATNLESIDGCRYVVKMVLTSKRSIERVAAAGGYPELDIERLNHPKEQSGSLEFEHYGKEILEEFGLNLPTGDDDIGIILRYESPDRYIDVWNGITPLRDTDNPFTGFGDFKGHGGINLVRCPHIQDAHTQNRIWGIGEVKPNEVQAAMLDDMWNGVFRREQFAGEPLIFYRKNSVNPDDLYWEMSNRIPVKDDTGRPIGDSVLIHSGQELPKDQFNLISALERNMDMTSSEYAPLRGEVAGGERITATEIMQVRETGSERHEVIIKNGEEIFLKSAAQKCLGMMNQFARLSDYAEIVGTERAIMLHMLHPNDLPGGMDFRFKGSNRVTNLLVKQRNLKELAPILITLYNAGQFQLARQVLESHDFQAYEIQAIEQENAQGIAALVRMVQMQQEQVANGQKGGRYQENNTKQMAQRNARTARGEK